ncbi:MAG: xylose isomerase [Gemmatimonadetes bacterium]|jgi:sugar phosphate isomerase/epimerase|nr:xylose isomerase [Gemmatimonadota bacterium]HCK12417.1 xylose isomerase [Candidatus Latescibacterota bacterium]
MKKIMFTKHLEGLDLKGVIQGLKSATVEGADLCVRPGYPVNPENIATALPEAAKAFADEGLVIPLVTAPGDLTRPDIDYVEAYYEACGNAGVGHIKLGYWHWTPEKHYWNYLDEIRGHMDGFQKLSEKTGVKTVVHNHSGKSMGLHSCAAMNVVKGFDPTHIGIFADPGHLSLCGEPIEMAIDIVRDYLSVFAFKDLIRHRPTGRNDQGTRKTGVVRLGTGFGDWPALIKTMKAINFEGPVSFHSEYSGEDVDTVCDLCRIDVRFIESLWNETD